MTSSFRHLLTGALAMMTLACTSTALDPPGREKLARVELADGVVLEVRVPETWVHGAQDNASGRFVMFLDSRSSATDPRLMFWTSPAFPATPTAASAVVNTQRDTVRREGTALPGPLQEFGPEETPGTFAEFERIRTGAGELRYVTMGAIPKGNTLLVFALHSSRRDRAFQKLVLEIVTDANIGEATPEQPRSAWGDAVRRPAMGSCRLSARSAGGRSACHGPI